VRAQPVQRYCGHIYLEELLLFLIIFFPENLQVLQETISAGDNWWAGDSIDLRGDDPNSLPPGSIQVYVCV